MEATVQLPDTLAHRLEELAEAQGTTVGGLIRQLVSEHVERRGMGVGLRPPRGQSVRFPLISAEKSGMLLPVTGTDLDQIFVLDHLAS